MLQTRQLQESDNVMSPWRQFAGFPAKMGLQDLLKCEMNEKKTMTNAAFFNKLDTYGQIFFRAFTPVVNLFCNIYHSHSARQFRIQRSVTFIKMLFAE